MPIDRIFAELHNPATWPPAPRPSMQPAYWRGLGRTPEQTRRRWPASRVNRGSRARPAANALHEKHSRRVRLHVEPLVAGLAKNVSAHTRTRFEVQNTGVTIRALSFVQRDHNAHIVRVILRNIFDQNGKYHPDSCSAKGDKPNKRKPDKHVVSSHSPGLPIDIGLAASAGSAPLMRATRTGCIKSCYCAPMIWVFPPVTTADRHICPWAARAVPAWHRWRVGR